VIEIRSIMVASSNHNHRLYLRLLSQSTLFTTSPIFRGKRELQQRKKPCLNDGCTLLYAGRRCPLLLESSSKSHLDAGKNQSDLYVILYQKTLDSNVHTFV